MPETPSAAPTMTAGQRRAVTLYALESSTGKRLSEDIQTMVTRGYSWRMIRDQVSENTDGQVSVSHEALRTWYGHIVAEDVA